MVIDKTTGKGCAWAMASKVVTKQLIAEGIVGKAIGIKPRRKRYALLHVVMYGGDVCITSTLKNDDELTEESFWTPSFIDTEVWRQAVSKFYDFGRLRRSVEEFLLPEMGEYLQNIPDTELVSMTKDLLTEHGVLHQPISQRAGNTYYFNGNEIYSLDKKSTLFPYVKQRRYQLFEVLGETCFNMNVWRKAVSQFKVGMTLNECISVFLKTELVYNIPQELTPVDRLVQSIASPIFERVPGNTDESTFDHIHITVGLPRYRYNSWEDLKGEIKKYQQEIYQRVIRRLEEDRQFKKYGVPINFLKMSDVILLRDFSLEYILELKELKTDLPL